MSTALPIHRVAVLVFADTAGVDARDATNRLAAAVDAQLGDLLPLPQRTASQSPDIRIRDVVDLTTATSNPGYLTIQPAPRLPHERPTGGR
ncbi:MULTISPECIES: hypothetical protein [Protofrankia]|uniref:Uncharacterized protein n=1 Tax=Candidatus Protofrankia datiscae TaxID=2716812 RepID=F8B0E3_9ACTN|nr:MULTISPECIES: hypothetical protein [Protofrankia]AEH08770.1 hypothetical protein FsymDg_1285 [Candidatus Protofrankia datiscae]